jgi:protein-S-isoprenylcysteine O-methyltransferase Ste14
MRLTWANTIKAVLWMGFMGALLFVPAGTLAWTGGWIFMGEMILGSAASLLWLQRVDPGLLKERLKGPIQKGQVFWDKVFMLGMVVMWYGWMVLMALDKRWAVSHMPLWLQVIGAMLIPIGFAGALWTFRENSFATAVVRIQEERGQRVIDTGPYAIVRHPMYAGAFFYMLGTPLVLGSFIGLATLPLIVGLLIVRIFIEERALRAGLPGYDDYAARVRHRLVPGVW